MEKFEIMKTVQSVIDSLPNDMNHTKGKLEELNKKLYETDRIDVVFKKEAYSPHNLKHKHLTNKEGFSQLLYRKVA
jgi:hypothetical protein